MPFSIQQRAAGVTAIQPGLRLEYILAFHPVEVVDLCTDHAGGQGPESPLFGMPDGHYMIPNPAPVRLGHAYHWQWLRDTLELEQGQIQWLGKCYYPRPKHTRQIHLGVTRHSRRLQKYRQARIGLSRPFLDDNVGIREDRSVSLNNRPG